MRENDPNYLQLRNNLDFLVNECSISNTESKEFTHQRNGRAETMEKRESKIYEEAYEIMNRIPTVGVNAEESDKLKKLVLSLPKSSKKRIILLPRLSKLCNECTQPYDDNKIFAFSAALSAGGAAFGFYVILQADSSNLILSFLFFVFLALTTMLFYLSTKMVIGGNGETRKQTKELFFLRKGNSTK